MNRWIPGLLLAGCILAAVGSPSRAAPPEPLKKLHILMVFDTADEDLGPSLWLDLLRLSRLWQSTIPADRYEIKVLVSANPPEEKDKDKKKPIDLKALKAVKADKLGDAIFA